MEDHSKLRTDHASLRWLCRQTEPSDQVARWLEVLAEFKYTIEHRAGPRHGNADGLSRQGCLSCKQCQRIEKRDGGPSRAELHQELLDRCDFCSCSWETDENLEQEESQNAGELWAQADEMAQTSLGRLTHTDTTVWIRTCSQSV